MDETLEPEPEPEIEHDDHMLVAPLPGPAWAKHPPLRDENEMDMRECP